MSALTGLKEGKVTDPDINYQGVICSYVLDRGEQGQPCVRCPLAWRGHHGAEVLVGMGRDLLGDPDDILGDILAAGALLRENRCVRRGEAPGSVCDSPIPASFILTRAAMAVAQAVSGRLGPDNLRCVLGPEEGTFHGCNATVILCVGSPNS